MRSGRQTRLPPEKRAERIRAVYDLLFRRYGEQHWWPGETPFEVAVGAILTQNTNWRNVERAIRNLKAGGLLTPRALHALSLEELQGHIRPAGYFRVKAKRLKHFLSLLVERYGGDLSRLFDLPPEELRWTLLSIHGIGPETADSILLYAAGLPSFVIDAYTRRIFSRLGVVETDEYEELRALFEASLPREVPLYNEYHALIVRLGKEVCKKRPRCGVCPLRNLCEAHLQGRV
jgi:endonuclease-3 related protein